MIFRPENMLFISICVEIYLLERYSKSKSWLLLLPIPLITFILNNMHPSAIFILFIYIAYAIQLLIERDQGTERRSVYLIIIIFFVSVLTSCFNPYGLSQLTLPIKFSSQEKVLEMTQEFMPILRTDYKWPFIFFSVASLISLMIKGNRRVDYALLYVLFGYLAFKYTRNVALFAIIMYIPIVKGSDIILKRYSIKFGYYYKLLSILIIIVVIIINVIFTIAEKNWGLGVQYAGFPKLSADFLKKQKFLGNMFNYYSFGGFLGWELYGNYLPSIDGRHYYYDKTWQNHDMVIYAQKGWANILKEYDVNVIIVPSSFFNGEIFPLIHMLDASKEWNLVVEEPSALLFVREQVIRDNKIQTIDKDLIWRHALQETDVYTDPGTISLNRGIALFKLHEFNKSLHYFRIYNGYAPADAEINEIIGLLEASANGSAIAKQEVENIYKRGRNQ
jgi:hypothetical protein